VVAVKGTAAAKSRLGASREQALAIALDTVAAAVAVADARVIVVTDQSVAPLFERLGAAVVADPGTGLNGAFRAGIMSAGGGPIACLQGDLPGLTALELSRALDAAAEHARAFVPDASGDGTVLLAARTAGDHSPLFGQGSARAHAEAGYVRLDLDDIDGLRHDVDTLEDLRALAGALGPRTARAFGFVAS
jgi:2-phospho-L-lactate guanylyltransferase